MSAQPRAHLEGLLDANPYPTIVTDASGAIVDVNGRAVRLLNLDRDTVRGRNIAGLLLPDDRAELWAILARLHHTDEVRGWTARLSPLFGGGAITLDVGAWREEDGTVGTLAWTIRPSTPPDVAHRPDPGVIGRLMDSLASGFIDLDENGTVTAINLRAAEALSSEPSDATGRPLADTPRSPLAAAIETAASQARDHRRRVAFEAGAGEAPITGEAIPVGGDVVVLFSDAGAPGVAREIHAAAGDLVAAAQPGDPDPGGDDAPVSSVVPPAQQTLARAAHELRTPASIISGFANTLRRHRRVMDDAEVDRIIERMGVAAVRLVDMLSNMLELGSPEGMANPLLEPIDVAEAVADAVDASPTDGTSIEVEIEHGLTAVADRDRLTHALVNLLANASKYGGGRIWVAAARRGDSVVISIADNGPGVQEDIASLVFEPFVRGRAGTGSGLGLAIARHALEGCGGSLDLVRNDRQGACFAISLPGMPPVA